MDKPIWLWVSFFIVVISALVMDLGVLHKTDRKIEVKESLVMSLFYIVVAILYGLWVGYSLDANAAKEYYTGFLVEKSLSIDNVFVISMIFSYFKIPAQFQHRVLFWGILGVIVLRALMIGAGSSLLLRFEWLLYVFGAFLVYTGIKMLMVMGHNFDIKNNPVLKFVQRKLPVTNELYGEKFIVEIKNKQGGRQKYATPLFLTLVMIEFADLIFAVDSVPAIFAITTDSFIVYTSNIFAILGLRALYFALAAIIHRFKYLKYSLAIILIFIGGKIFLVSIIGKIPSLLSLLLTLIILGTGVVYSLYKTKINKLKN
ncbi:TerC family protein [Rickettsiales endosymbiont of Stachyamoeba lipophora]|uniref:TerC family protein n=1 Tax=Rickettsiales endosymbiont of Stachyamoeba lipophora TaxID=2486578 RepID=UPI000F64ADC8|nr:TerC family protein [Rickettsiales endosymbiont of Stachyamoeba lipophora]AZL15413.1 TerC family protein [Rickettsiales endosymbiont of Stachyamoeba lipophora]